MPPVRWKILYVTMAISLQLWSTADAQHMQDAISMTSDGWRPIVGSRRQPPAFSQDTRISQYKNPSQKYEVEIVKSENPVAVSSTASPNEFTGKPRESSTSSINNINAGPLQQHSQGGKIPVHTKFTSPGYHTIPPNSHGQQIPLGAVTQGRTSQYGFRKPPAKPPTHYSSPPKRKPLRGPQGANSNRNEVFVHAPATVNLLYLKPGPSNVKTRETQGLKSGHHFSINQPNSHIEINRFPHPPTNDNVFEQIKSLPVTYAFPNLKDEYTRNLVPPPPSRFLIEKEKLKAPKLPAKFKDNVATVSEPVLEFHELGLQHFGANSPQENLVQLSLPFGQQYQLQNQFQHDDHGVNVEVTKEQLKVFHNNVPTRFNQKPQDYADYFQSVTNLPQIPKLQTYEVTEGKWVDNPNPYHFKYQQTQDFPQRVKKPSGPSRPIIPEPLVELNLPPFLPTPYRPTGARPTSATQSEASTVFSQVSTKMNRYKGDVLTKNPLFFDLKEVSTHYPILGKPDFGPDSETDTPLSVGGNGEISNEITTHRPKKRRRPQPRKPTTTVSPTTTTEEPATTDNFNFRKQNFESSHSEETERPYRRQRPGPNRMNAGATGSGSYESEERPQWYRTTTLPSVSNEGDERKPLRYRTTPPPSERDEGEVRSTLRYRTTLPPNESDEGDVTNNLRHRTTRPPSESDEGEVRNNLRHRTTRPPSESDEGEVRNNLRHRTTRPPSESDEGDVRNNLRHRTTRPPSESAEEEVRTTLRYRTTSPPSDSDEGEVGNTFRHRTTTPPSDGDERGRRRPLRYRTSPPPSNREEGDIRKTLRYRTTASPSESDEGEEKRVRGRHRYRQRAPVGNKDANELQHSFHRKRVRTTTEMPTNHKVTDEDQSSFFDDASPTAEGAKQSIEFKYSHNMDEEEAAAMPHRLDYEAPVRHHHVATQDQEESNVRYETTPSDSEHMDSRAGVVIEEITERDNTHDEVAVSSTTKEPILEINLPENEIDYSSPSAAPEQNEDEYIQTTLATTIPTTTTTEAQTTKPVRTRGRPIKYHSSNRPRFSVKDYRQRLNQYTSTTPSTTTDFVKTTSEVTRVRFPNRLRTRPYHSTSSAPSHQEEESNTDQIQRRKFIPKDPRHSHPSTTTESSDIITESNEKSVNAKLRPFGRYSNSTRSKSNLFSTRRKALVSMRTKLFNKPADVEDTTVLNEEPTEPATLPMTVPEEEAVSVETSTEFHLDRTNIVEPPAETVPPTVEAVINDDDYSQRVSDLTSSFKNQYETPGFFKTVSPNSRRVPNYFTISTDDPILPIEAFFPSIKDKEQ